MNQRDKQRVCSVVVKAAVTGCSYAACYLLFSCDILQMAVNN